ncbi:hypothetical protein [Massilia sp. TN1-12]|uniref:hypothetical protein n=1 Tax=Massilia paldalensis TaxID=3377675 RepID=UPI00384B9934
MKIDVEGLQGMLDIYRSATDLKIPVHASLKGHFIKNRQQLLDGFAKMASAQNMMLGCLVPQTDDEKAQLIEAKRIVEEFGDWAKGIQ